MVPLYFDKISFNSGVDITPEQNALVVFVGPNNGGKSTALKDLAARLAVWNQQGDHRVIRYSTLASSVSPVVMARDLYARSKPTQNGRRIAVHDRAYDFNESMLAEIEARGTPVPEHLLGAFARLLHGEDRLTVSNQVQSHSVATESASHPLQRLYEQDHLEAEISAHVRRAFGKGIVVNRSAGSQILLHYGEAPKRENGEEQFHQTYQNKLMKLPFVSRQGDGLRAFVSVVLSAYCASHSIILVDEPEAFLHPPQALELGRVLSRTRPDATQVFVATHSSDVLRGIIDNATRPITIVRLERDGSANQAQILSASDVRGLSGDSLLRHSQLLDGLFHDRVILCEADSDCRFYNVLWEGVRQNEKSETRHPDILFAPLFGKDRAASASKLLTQAKIRSSVVLDFDALNNLDNLKRLVVVRGGDWTAVESLAKVIDTSARSLKGMAANWPERQKEIVAAIEVEKEFPRGSRLDRIRDLLSQSSSWDLVKKKGKDVLPAGDVQAKAKQLLEALSTIGIHIVPVGELE